ncbi:selection and upkeep of intraepithelial T-cells protein 1-like [Epinephelus fuscoguttatus]|uniref:selection and upkeep of intraepithelial T-cells protein 1-like n=1 Tax=Epinephelus fuscoguttatus TaxID=293821 RepID=UPI0020D0A643|nr:selection and upkeep of intraepithelial T-cells protein 1-like [Epinephelus fuscoguttatus]
MKLTGFSFFFCCSVQLFNSVMLPASGKPVQSAPPGRVSAAAGTDVILPCGLTSSYSSSGVRAVEWTRVDGPSPVTVHVVRDGEELVREKAAEYHRRTAILEDGSLKLFGVQQRDNGTYRCGLLRGSTVEDVFVSLFVAQVSEVFFSVRRSSANQLQVQCESSGWSPEPLVSLLDSSRNVLAARVESSVRPDFLYSVRALVTTATAATATGTGNGTLICRVEIPGTNLANENKIHITDEFHPPEEGPGCYLVLLVAFLLVFVVTAVMVFVVPLGMIKKLRSSLQRLTVLCYGLIRRETEGQQEDQPLLGEYGDISRVDTTGASEHLARANESLCRGVSGVEASQRLADRDLQEMLKYKETISSVGNKLGVHPALIAAIISRQSQAGTSLRPDGYGKGDHNCFGLMQINKHYHAVKGHPFSVDHVDQGVTYFIQLIKTMERTKPDWTKEQQLKGALACYISGEERVTPLSYDQVDSVTPYGDFANDVVARAQWFSHNGF